MKTNHVIRAITSLVLLFVSQQVSAGVIPLSSGIKSQIYSLEWCAPHGSRVNVPSGCMEGTLTDVGGVATIRYNGQNFPAGGVSANPIIGLPGSTRTTETLMTAGGTLISLFSNSTSGAMSLEGEGVVTVRATLTDYADNTSFIWVRYKIDKTGPQIAINGMSENSDYAHYQGTVNTSIDVTKNDSALNNSTGTKYADPAISTYANKHTAVAQSTGHNRSPLHTIYFQNTTSGVGANTPFNLALSMSDTFDGYLLPNGAGTSYSGPLVAGLLDMELRDEAGSASLGVVPLSGDMTTGRLVNNVVNGQSKYRLRLFDKSVDVSGAIKSGNYSEAAFYAVRDNTEPNIGGNGGEATLAAAYERLLQFPDNATVYDKTAYSNGYTPTSNGVSRMFGATDSLAMNYRLNDTGITGNGVNTTGTSAGQFDLYNAGINTSSTEFRIENAENPGIQETFVQYSNRYENTGTKNKDFSRVDNKLVTNGTYRKYGTSFQTASIPRLCDYVGNCLTPSLEFRVAAAPLSTTVSNLTIDMITPADGKMLANGVDRYTLAYRLRDSFSNKVVPVISVENNSTQFKTVESTVKLNNGLYTNQLTSNPTGAKLVIANDLEIDNSPVVDVSAVNTTGIISALESPNNIPNGNYQYSFASGVPSKGLYPYISDNSRLEIQALANVATSNAPAGATYPSTGDRIGTFAPIEMNAGNTNDMIRGNNGNIEERGGSNDIYVNTADYGKITRSPTDGTIAFTDMPGRRINFEYASPYVYGLIGRQVLVDGKYSNHFKKLYVTRAGTNAPYNVYEKDIVTYHTGGQDEQPGILNFTLRDADGSSESLTNSGVRLKDTPGMIFTNTSSTGAFAFIRDAENKNMPIETFSGSGREVSLQMSSIPTFGAYDNNKLRVGLVSALAYEVAGNTIQLPSVGRGLVQPGTNNTVGQYNMSRKYFDGDYQIGDAADIVNPLNAAALTDIAITGLTNQYNSITTESGATQANTVIEAEISRSSFVTTIKKNVATLTAGFGSGNPKKWCNVGNINQSILSGTDAGIADCTVETNGEKITFIEGNATLDCGSTLTACMVNTKRTLVVRNGSLTLKSNISTRDASGNQTPGQLVLVSMATDGLSDITVGTTIDRTAANVKGWMFVGTEITNIDAFLVAQGPIVSFDQAQPNISKVYGKDDTREVELVNQLHINGSMLALNTIGGGRDNVGGNYTCPYVVENCNQNTAQYFDLIFMRRFKAIGLSYFTNEPTQNSILVPYYPDRSLVYDPGVGSIVNGAKRSGGFTGTNGTDANPLVPAQTLRHITDSAYQSFPMLIERDTRWNNSPSRLFLSGN